MNNIGDAGRKKAVATRRELRTNRILRAKQMHADGIPHVKIAEKLGVSARTIARYVEWKI